MIALIAFSWPGLLLCMLVGFATAGWAWRNPVRPDDQPSPLAELHLSETWAAGAAAAATEPAAPQDDLTRIEGLDDRMAKVLNLLGITRFADIAGWSEADAGRMNVLLGLDTVQISQQQWVEQARRLASGEA